MGRGRTRAGRAPKDKDTRDILRDRDRKLSSYDQLLAPDSSTPGIPPARILRNNIDSHRMPVHSPKYELRSQFPNPSRKRERARKTNADRIQLRAQLMSAESTHILDLTNIDPDIDTATPADENESRVAQDDDRTLEVPIYVGFAGYSTSTSDHQHQKLNFRCLKSPPDFQRFVRQALQKSLQNIGLTKYDFEIAGYEVRFPAEYVYNRVCIQAGQKVILRSSNILLKWAELSTNDFGILPDDIIVRIIKKDGTMFDPTFRTPRETLAEPVKPSDSIEPGVHDGEAVGISKLKDLKRQARREMRSRREPKMQGGTTEEKAERKEREKQAYHEAKTRRETKKQARREAKAQRNAKKLDPIARREKLSQQAAERIDMLLLEGMMSGHNLLGGNTVLPFRGRLELASGVPQQDDEGRGHAERGSGGMEDSTIDLEMG